MIPLALFLIIRLTNKFLEPPRNMPRHPDFNRFLANRTNMKHDALVSKTMNSKPKSHSSSTFQWNLRDQKTPKKQKRQARFEKIKKPNEKGSETQNSQTMQLFFTVAMPKWAKMHPHTCMDADSARTRARKAPKEFSKRKPEIIIFFSLVFFFLFVSFRR